MAPSEGNSTQRLVDLSVVIPVYGCADCLEALHERLVAACRQVTESYEVIYVDDRSPDSAWPGLQRIAADPHVRAFRLTRNFGQQAAITAGFEQAHGRWTVVMDCDLEDPPELIPELWSTAHEGHEIVIVRRGRADRSFRRRLASRLYFWALRTFLGSGIDPAYGCYSILSEKARAAFLQVRDVDRHYIPILTWIGMEPAEIDGAREPRHAGESSYGFRDLIRAGLDGVFFQTTTLLRYVVYVGFGISAFGLLLAAFYVYTYLTADALPGFTTIAVLLMCLSGFIIVSLGVTGLYIGKIFQQVKGRPLYLIDESLGGGSPEAGRSSEEMASAGEAP
jgi:dolichol-phosphate mannosyltransferase